MSEIRTNIEISGDSLKYRSNISISVVTLDNNLIDSQSSFRTDLHVSTKLSDGNTSEIKTNLELSNTNLTFDLVDMTKLNQTVLYFSKLINLDFEEDVLWELLNQGTDEQINSSHIAEALSPYIKEEKIAPIIANIDKNITTVNNTLHSHINNSIIHLTEDEKSFLSSLMTNPPEINTSEDSFWIEDKNGDLVPKSKEDGTARGVKVKKLYIPNSDGSEIIYQIYVGELGEGADIPSEGGGGTDDFSQIKVYDTNGILLGNGASDGKITIMPYPVVPTKVSAFENDEGFLKEEDISGLATRVDTAETNITNLGKRADGLQGDIEDVQDDVATILNDYVSKSVEDKQEIASPVYIKNSLTMNRLYLPNEDNKPSSYELMVGVLGAGADTPEGGGSGTNDWNAIINKPTTLAGYGITDAIRSIRGTNVDVTNTTTDLYGYWGAMSTHHGINSIYYHILNLDWNNDLDNWISQLAIPTGSSSLTNEQSIYYRNRHSSTWSDWVKVLDSNNYSDYALPKSGGTINGLVTFANQEIALGSMMLAYTSEALRVRTLSGDSWFGMMNGGSCHIYTDAPQFYMNKPLKVDNGYEVIHSGNIGSQSVSFADSAGYSDRLLSPYSYEGGASINNDTTPESLFGSSYTFSAMMENCAAFNGYASVLNFTGYKQYGGVQLAVHYDNTTPRMALRNFSQTSWKFTDWREIAFTDSTVAAANSVYSPSGKEMVVVNDGSAVEVFGSVAYDTYVDGKTLAFRHGSSYATAMTINSSGNVLIGTTENTGNKLDVRGKVLIYDSSKTSLDSTVVANSALLHISSIASANDGLYIGHLSNGVSWLQSAYHGSTSYPSSNHAYPISLNSLGGNVLIGITTDYGYKLYVAGNISASAEITNDTTMSTWAAYQLRFNGNTCGLFANYWITNGGDANTLWLYNAYNLALYGSRIELHSNAYFTGNISIGTENAADTTQKYLYFWKGDGSHRHRGLMGVNEGGAFWNYYCPDTYAYTEILLNSTGATINGNISASGYQLPTSAPSNPVSGGYYLYVGTLGAGATIS